MTGANLTTFRLALNRFPVGAASGVTADDAATRSLAARRPVGDYATVYDILLALYHGVVIQSMDGLAGGCLWAGKDRLFTTLVKVFIFDLLTYLRIYRLTYLFIYVLVDNRINQVS